MKYRDFNKTISIKGIWKAKFIFIILTII